MGDSLKVCLTGGIASGKNTVSDEFVRLGVELVDTDVLARQVVEKGTNGLQQLVDVFGQSILTQKGGLNRSKLRRLVFADDNRRHQLNQILHPLIHQAVVERLEQVSCLIAMVVIPLYTGQEQYDWFDRVCVVDVAENIQLERLLQRDSIDESLARQMIGSQIGRKQRLSLADDVLNNNGDKQALIKRVGLLMDFYRQGLV